MPIKITSGNLILGGEIIFKSTYTPPPAPTAPAGYMVCPLLPNNPHPIGTNTSKGFWEFMENTINPFMWLYDNSPLPNANTTLGRYDDRANPGKYVRSLANIGGLRTLPNNRYPYGAYMTGQSNNDWSGVDHGSTYGSLPGDFTIMFGFKVTQSMPTPSRIAGCFENNDTTGEWVLYVEADILKFRWWDTNGTLHTPTGGIDVSGMTDESVCVITRDNSVGAGGIEFTTYEGYPGPGELLTTATADNDITFPKRTDTQYFQMKNPTGIFTYGRMDITNYTMVNRKISAAEQREFADWMRYARNVDNPHSITNYAETRLYRSGVVNYLTFNQNNGTTLIDEETHSYEGMTLTGATDTASNTWSTPLPANYGGGTGQTISSTKMFSNNQLGSPYFDMAWQDFYNMEFLISGVQSSNGNDRTLVAKWANDPLNNYFKLELNAANQLVFTVQDYRVVASPVDAVYSWVIAELGDVGSALFETDNWQTVHLRITSGILLAIDGVVVYNRNLAALGNTPYVWKYGYDNPSHATPSVIGGGSESINAGAGIVQGTTAVFDTFTGAAGTDLSAHAPDTDTVGGGWSQETANDGELDGIGGLQWASSTGVAWIDSGQLDQFVKINVNPGGQDNRFSIHLRHDGNTDATSTAYYFNIRIGAGGTGEATILTRINGVNTTISSIAYLGTPDLNATHEFVAGVVGNDLVLYMNGSKILTHTDSAITTGTYIGIRHNQFIDGALRYLDITAGAATSANDAVTGWELGIAHFTWSAVYSYAKDANTSLLTTDYGHNLAQDVMSSWKYSVDGNFYDYPYNIFAAVGNVMIGNTNGWYFPLLDQPGTNANDAGGNNGDITYAQDRSTVGYEALLPATVGRWGINLDGTANTVVEDQIGSPSTGSITGNIFTIFCLFSVTASGTQKTLVGKWGTDFNQAQWQIQTDAADSNALKFRILQSDNTEQSAIIVPSLSASGVAADGQWHSLLIQSNGTDLNTRIDSVAEDTIDVSGWSGTWRNSTAATSSFMIGGSGVASEYWTGKASTVFVLNEAITDCEAADIEQTFLLGYAPA